MSDESIALFDQLKPIVTNDCNITVPQFEDPIAICAIGSSGTYHLMEVLNSDKICTDHWDQEFEYLSEFEHETLTSCVVQCKITYHSYQSYEGEWDGHMEITDIKILWQHNPKPLNDEK